jgi:hypothetical protein
MPHQPQAPLSNWYVTSWPTPRPYASQLVTNHLENVPDGGSETAAFQGMSTAESQI